jgi:lipopolysaccharide export system permease protein
MVLILSPISTYGLRLYYKLEDSITNKSFHNINSSNHGIFFFEEYMQKQQIIRIKTIDISKNEIYDVTLLIINKNHELMQRIDAPSAKLENGYILLDNATVIKNNNHTQVTKTMPMIFPSNLSVEQLIQRFSNPEIIMLWNLRKVIDNMSVSGMPNTSYKIYYSKQLFKPLMMLSLSLLACWFTIVNTRSNKPYKALIAGIIIGIFSYFLIEVGIRILSYSGIEPMVATILPLSVIILLSNFVILHFHEA